MSARPSLIRWERVGPVLLVTGAFAFLIVLFLDPFLKTVLIRAGQGVFGAKVTIESLETRFKTSRLSIRGLKVADKSQPMRNLFQWDEATFDFRAAPLFEKKVIIDEAKLTGLKFGTPRKTSGALTLEDRRPGFVGKAAEKMWGRIESVSLEKIGELKKDYDPKAMIGSLESLKTAEKAKEQIEKTPEQIETQIKQLNAEQRIQTLQQRVDAFKQTGKGPEAILKKASEGKAIQEDLQALRRDIAETQRSVMGRIQSAQGLVEEVRKAREEDWKSIRSKLSLPTLDKASIARALFGPTLAQWGERLLNGVHIARRHMPTKPKSPPPPPRGRGRTIEFPRSESLPRFLLAKAQVSGEIGQEKPFGFSGLLTGLTTNPKLYGRPATAVLQGAQGARAFNFKGVVDHTRETPLESLQGSYAGFSLNNLSFGQKDSLGFGLAQGTGRARAAVTIQGETLMGHAEMEGANLTVQPQLNLDTESPVGRRAAAQISASLAGVKAMSLGVDISGTLSSPRLAIQSNIGSIVSDALKSALGAEVAEQEKALRAEFDKRTAGRLQELQNQVSGLQQQYLPQLASKNKVIEDLLSQLAGGGLRNIFGK